MRLLSLNSSLLLKTSRTREDLESRSRRNNIRLVGIAEDQDSIAD